MPSPLEKVIEKVRKLRALSTSSNEHEAAAAAAAAARLIQEHRLAEAALEQHVEQGARVDRDPLDTFGARVPSWKMRLSNGLAKLHGCICFSGGLGENRASFLVGDPGDVLLVRDLYAWLVGEVVRLSLAHAGKGQSFVNTYRCGCVDGVVAAMFLEQQAVQRTASSTALTVLEARTSAAADALHAAFGRLRTTVRRVGGADEAYAAGRRDGAKISAKKALATG